jgi:hypothetical protein
LRGMLQIRSFLRRDTSHRLELQPHQGAEGGCARAKRTPATKRSAVAIAAARADVMGAEKSVLRAAVIAWSAATDSGFQFEAVGENRREPVDFDGLTLVKFKPAPPPLEPTPQKKPASMSPNAPLDDAKKPDTP